MEKLVGTVYRQLYKKAAKVEKDIALRSVLTCSPLRVYDHRRREWVAFDIKKQAGWPEPRIFLDNLIRKLNGDREFYIPIAKDESDGERCNSTTRKAKKGSSCSNDGSCSGSSSGGNHSRGSGEASPSLVQTLRHAFENTPFTVSQLNNAFAALKELSYVTDMAAKHYGSGVSPPEAAKTLPTPVLTVVNEVEEMHHISLTKGLSDVLEKVANERRGVSRTSEEDVRVKEEDVVADSDNGSIGDCKNSDLVFGEMKSNKTTFETPATVQLLLAHPQLYDFFRHSVMIVARSTPNESAAFVLNKPLENDEGMLMPVNATIRLNHVHPILGRHLSNHTVMIGGPVTRDSFDSSVLLLHRIPDVDDAIPLSHSLWIDGNYDVLQKKLEDGTADAKDIMVMCGFSGWGERQLAGEIRSGTWVVARGSTNDPAVDDFIFALARHAGTPPSPAAAAATAAATLAENNRRRNAAAWAWAFRALGPPYADLARNQKPLLQDPADQ